MYVQSDTLLLVDVFENVRNKCIEIYELDPGHFLPAPSIFKENRNKIRATTNVDMFLMVEKGIRGGTCHAIHRCAKANNKYMKNYNKKKESQHIQYLDENNLYGWAMSQKLPVNDFKWRKKKKILN